jgi:hypothetical protein
MWWWRCVRRYSTYYCSVLMPKKDVFIWKNPTTSSWSYWTSSPFATWNIFESDGSESTYLYVARTNRFREPSSKKSENWEMHQFCCRFLWKSVCHFAANRTLQPWRPSYRHHQRRMFLNLPVPCKRNGIRWPPWRSDKRVLQIPMRLGIGLKSWGWVLVNMIHPKTVSLIQDLWICSQFVLLWFTKSCSDHLFRLLDNHWLWLEDLVLVFMEQERPLLSTGHWPVTPRLHSKKIA